MPYERKQLAAVVGVVLTAISLVGGATIWTVRNIAKEEISRNGVTKDAVQQQFLAMQAWETDRHSIIEKRLDEIRDDTREVRRMLLNPNLRYGTLGSALDNAIGADSKVP